MRSLVDSARLIDAFHLDVERYFVLHLDNFGKADESINELLSQNFLDNVFVVIIPESATQFIIVHVEFVFS